MEKSKRIGSIDALRGITLLFILLVHSTAYFGFANVQVNDLSFMTSMGHYLAATINWLLEGRANKIFCMLFGVSFYLILRKPENSSLKFVLRCFLLSLFGLINLMFYSSDVLLWYGIMGCVLVLFRNCSPRTLLISFICLFILNFFSPNFVYSNLAVFSDRYSISNSIIKIMSYPIRYGYSIWFTTIPFHFLAYFILGYCIAKSGIIENLKRFATLKNVVIFLAVNILLIVITCFNRYFNYSIELGKVVKGLIDLFGAYFYILLFLKIYYTYNSWDVFKWLESYGRLGLTNYSFQGIIGVIVSLYVVMPLKLSYEYAIILYLGIYIYQIIFSYYWLKLFRNGPLEWLWRCLTSLHFTNPLIEKTNKNR